MTYSNQKNMFRASFIQQHEIRADKKSKWMSTTAMGLAALIPGNAHATGFMSNSLINAVGSVSHEYISNAHNDDKLTTSFIDEDQLNVVNEQAIINHVGKAEAINVSGLKDVQSNIVKDQITQSLNNSSSILAASTFGSENSAGFVQSQREFSSAQTPFNIDIVDAGEKSDDPHKIQIVYDELSAQPILSVGIIDNVRTTVRGEATEFLGYTNYPAFIKKSEIRIFETGQASDSNPIAIVDINKDGYGKWTSSDEPSSLYYVYRVYDARGNFDETAGEELTLVEKKLSNKASDANRPSFGQVDEAKLRNIILRNSSTITVRGTTDSEEDLVRIAGQIVPVDTNGEFATQQIISEDMDSIPVDIMRGEQLILSSLRNLPKPSSKWFFVGQGDLTFISSNGEGPAVEVTGDRLSDGDFLTSRAAFYLKGELSNDVRITGSLDTGEQLLEDLFSNIDRKDPTQLLRRLDSDEFYPVYGDDSTLVQDTPTQTGFYVRVEQADSSLLVGNFITQINQAELAQLERGLFGAIIDFQSDAVTSFGEKKLQLTSFASDPGTVPARDEFRGTGGSLYFLQQQDISIGSERLRVEIRDRETGLVLETVELRPQEDYDIDYFQGRVTLNRPLASIASDGGTVRQGSSSGNIPVLVARYEFSPSFGDLDGYTFGGRGAGWIGDTVRLGVTSQKETTEGADQTLLGADILIRHDAGTYVKAEIARTEGPGFGQSNSVDGGLNFVNFASPGIANVSAEAYRAEAAVNFSEITGGKSNFGSISGYFEHFDAGFSSISQLTSVDTDRWGVKADLALSNSTDLKLGYDVISTDGLGSRRAGTVDLKQGFGSSVSATLGLRYDRRVEGILQGRPENGDRTDAALQINYEPSGQDLNLYGFGQFTLDNDVGRQENNRGGAGIKAQLTERLSLAGEVSGGDGGLGADVQLNRRLGEGSEAYIGYSLLADRTDTGLEAQNIFTNSNSGTLTAGARQRFSTSLSVYGENRIGIGGPAPSVSRSFGLNFDPDAQWSFSASFENGRIDDQVSGLFRRTAATFGVGYSGENFRIGSSVEGRFEEGNGRDQNVWLVRNSASAQLNDSFRLLGRLNFAIADNDVANVRAADFVEGSLGFAYRPVDNDRLNILARYNYFQDLGPIGQITQGGTTASPKQRSQIISVDVNYDITKAVTLGAKYGYREGSVSLGRDSDTFVSSDTHLGIVRADIHIIKSWDLLLEGRVLTNDLAGDTRYGALAAIYRHVGNNAKIGVGYSLSDFSDDLTNQSFNSEGVFFNILGKF